MQEEYTSNSGHKLVVIKDIDSKKCIVQFVNTGFTKEVYKDNLKAGKVKDPYERSTFSIGYYGEPDKSLPYWKKAKQLWSNMFKRCYSEVESAKGYKWKGTTVDARWENFALFLEDLHTLDGFDQWLLGGMNLDKDYKVPDNNVYSREACCFIPESLNKAMGARNGKPFTKKLKLQK
jgi:hypothetical protein